MNRRILAVVAIVLIVAGIFAMSSLFIVDQTEEALVLQFGQGRTTYFAIRSAEISTRAVADRPGRNLCSRAYSESTQYILDVLFGSPLDDHQPFSNFAIGATFGDEHDHFAFAWTECRERHWTRVVSRLGP